MCGAVHCVEGATSWQEMIGGVRECVRLILPPIVRMLPTSPPFPPTQALVELIASDNRLTTLQGLKIAAATLDVRGGLLLAYPPFPPCPGPF